MHGAKVWGSQDKVWKRCGSSSRLRDITWIFKVPQYLSWLWLQSGTHLYYMASGRRGPVLFWRCVRSRGKGWALGSGRPEFRFWFHFLPVLWTSTNYFPSPGTQLPDLRSKVSTLVIKDDRLSISINLSYLSKCYYSNSKGILILRHKLIEN